MKIIGQIINAWQSFVLFTRSASQNSSTNLGFTLIELLVVFSVTAILAGVGIAGLASYSRSQQLNQSANSVKTLINQARFSALSAVKSGTSVLDAPVSCGEDPLIGYSIEVLEDRIHMRMVCATGNYDIKSLTLPEQLIFDTVQDGGTACTQFMFDPLTAKSTGLPCNIVISGFGQQKTVTVDTIGNTSIN